MQQATKNAVKTILRNDPTVDNRNIDPAMDVLSGKLAVQMAYAGLVDPTVSRTVAANMIGISVRTVDYLGKKGKLKRRFVEGEHRAHGYSLASIRKYQAEKVAE